MASFVEESKMIDLKTLSDGLNVSDTGDQSDQEEQKEEEDGEEKDLEETDIIDEDETSDASVGREESEFPKIERSESASQTSDEDPGLTDLLSEMTGELDGYYRS